MSRLLFGLVAVLVLCGGVPCLAADEPAASRPTQRKLAIERALDSPLNWKPGDREHVTLAELIDFIREEHHLQVRWDVASLRLVFGDEAPLGELISGSVGPQAALPPAYAASTTMPLYAMRSQPALQPGQSQPRSWDPYATPTVYGQNPSVPSAATTQAPVANDQPASALGTLQAGQPVPAGQPVYGTSAAQQLQPAVADNSDAPVSDMPVADQPEPELSALNGSEEVIAEYVASPVSLSSVALERATVREALQQLLDAVSPRTTAVPLEVGVPFTTRALALDLLVDENSVLITTQLRANAKKETRVYRLSSLSNIPPESLERVIMHSVRPWSWRNQANDIAEQLVSRWPKNSIPLPAIELNATEGIKLNMAAAGSGEAGLAHTTSDLSADAVTATGKLLAGGAVAVVHSIVAALEIVHHGDPPTGVIESLPGMLIITQSQAAHREIRELLYELGEQ